MSQKGLQVLILGELNVINDTGHLAVPGSRKTRALLAYLLLQNRPVTREHLCELLWPHPDNPRAALRWSLSKLRPLLIEHLVTDRNSVVIKGLEDRVDLRQVDTLLRQPIDSVTTGDLEAAAGLFHGELLEGMEIPDCHRFNEWLIARSEAARRSRRTILETLTRRLAEDPENALIHARSRLAMNPLDEAAHVDVVRLLGSLGRRTEAQDQANRCREILNLEMGEVPGPELDQALRDMRKRSSPVPIVAQPPVSVRPAAAAEAGLFGRAEECIRLEGFLDTEGQRPILYFEGEPGIGKSRLLTELQQRAQARDILVLIGRSWEVEMIRPFGVWIELLAGLPRDLIPDALRANLAPLIPSLEEPVRPDGELEKLMRAVKELIASFQSTRRTVLFVFDDIHWIDQASAELLGHISSFLTDQFFGLVCAGRPGEFADNEAARSLVRGWNRSGILEAIPIAPLANRDALALARSIAEADEVESLVASCGGNPLYLIESAREGTEKNTRQVSSLVADRLSVLDEPTCAIARWAAVLGHAFPASRMAELLSQPLSDFLERTEALERHGILRPHGDGWDFSHDLLRRATLADLSAPRRSLMHRRIARTMATEPDPDGSLAGEVAYHAARGGEPGLAARSAVAAGDRALRLAAFGDAFRIADRGLLEAAKLADASVIELKVELLRVLVLASMGRKRGEAIIEQLSNLASQAHAVDLHATERTARWLLSVVTEEAGDFEAARQHSIGAEEASRTADPRTRLNALANTARCLLQLEREPIRARVLLGEAQELSESLQTPLLDIPWANGLLCFMDGEETEARTAFGQGAAMAHAAKNHWALFECLSRLSMLDLNAGNLAGVEGRHEALHEVADKLGEGSEIALANTLLALARRQSGSDSAELDAALSELRVADSKGLLAYALNEAGRLDLANGDFRSAARCAAEALQAATDVGRHHQYDRASCLQVNAALVAGDEETTHTFILWSEARLKDLSPNSSIHKQIHQLREKIFNQREQDR